MFQPSKVKEREDLRAESHQADVETESVRGTQYLESQGDTTPNKIREGDNVTFYFAFTLC